MSNQPNTPQSKEEKRNLMLAIGLALGILVVWQLFFASPQERALEEVQVSQDSTTEATPADPSIVAEPSAAGDTNFTGLNIPSQDSSTAQNPEAVSATSETRVTIRNSKVEGSINLKGALLDDLILESYNTTIDKDSQLVTLLRKNNKLNPYFASFGWVGDTDLPNKDTVWNLTGTEINSEDGVLLSWTNPQNITFEQEWSLNEDYLFNVKQRVINNSDREVNVASYGLISRSGVPELQGFAILHEGLLGVFDESLEEVDYEEISEAKKIDYSSANGGWLGITDKYWLTALIPDQSADVNARFINHKSGLNQVFQTDFVYPLERLSRGQSTEKASQIFAGAKVVELLDDIRDSGVPLFDRAIDFGWLYFLTKPLFLLLNLISSKVVNMGIAIVLLTLVVRLVLFPLASRSFASMSKMKKLQPQVAQLKEIHGDNRSALSQEMMKLYKKEGVNPMSGCWPIMIQIPVFFALYKVFFVTIEVRHAPFFGWIKDLSAPDPAGILTAFGLIDWNVPAILAIANIGIWPVLMGLTMYLQQKLNPQPTDPIQKQVFKFLPFIFTFLLGSMPAGLVIYWTFSNTFSIAQQWVIMKRVNRS